MATFHTLENLFWLITSPVFGTEKDSPQQDYMDNLKNDFLSQYRGYPFGIGNDDFDDDINVATVVLGLLSPGHVFLDDVWKWGWDKITMAEQGKFRPDNTPDELVKFFVKNKIEKPIQEAFIKALNSNNVQEGKKILEDAIESGKKGVEKTKEKATEVVTDIADSEAGFRAWCLRERKTPREVEPYNPDTHFAYTNDGKKWFYDNGTFNPKPE